MKSVIEGIQIGYHWGWGDFNLFFKASCCFSASLSSTLKNPFSGGFAGSPWWSEELL